MGIYKNTDNSLSDERAEAILKTRPTGLKRMDAPPPKPAPAPKPKAKVEAPKPKAKKGE